MMHADAAYRALSPPLSSSPPRTNGAASPTRAATTTAATLSDDGAAPAPSRALQDSLARIKTAAYTLDRATRQGAHVDGGIICACVRALEDVLAVSDAVVEEDFHLLTTLGKQLDASSTFDASLLLSRVGGVEREIEALARARAFDAASVTSRDAAASLEEEYELATRRVVAKMLAVVELHEATRADRIKLLADLVTASRME